MFRIITISILLLTVEVAAQIDSLVSYYNNGKIESIVHLRDNVRDGDASFYWDNGNPKEELTYVNGRVEGLVRRYNQEGVLQEMFTIENGKREGPTSLFDSTGKYIDDIYYEEGILVVDKIVLDSGPKQEEKKEDVIAVIKPQNTQKKKKQNNDDFVPPTIEEEKNYEDDPAFYKTVEVLPEPYGGMEAIYKKIGYPKEAKEEKIEGVVKILTFVDRDGEVLDAQVLEGIGFGCDEAARLAILYHRFKPGLIKGQKVKVQMEIPIEFKLEEKN
ncbi:MAG: TonB family protein [Ignavibacteriaceae bacterium]|jgi:TonB family protein|nr:TonB family protein [Ignavibacteriaceae bacterium]MCU0365460.1 TonB family protein [Ignavibacteriaceae bacterium]